MHNPRLPAPHPNSPAVSLLVNLADKQNRLPSFPRDFGSAPTGSEPFFTKSAEEPLSDRNRQSHRQRVEGHGVPLVEVGDGSAPLLGLVGPDHPRDADRNGADFCSGPRSLGWLTASELVMLIAMALILVADPENWTAG